MPINSGPVAMAVGAPQATHNANQTNQKTSVTFVTYCGQHTSHRFAGRVPVPRHWTPCLWRAAPIF